jgi:hypothetical protein
MIALMSASLAKAAVTNYAPIQDTYMRGGLTDLHGTSTNGRASKAFLDFYLSDFDRFAIVNAIQLELGHALTLGDFGEIEISWNLFSNDFQGYQPTSLSRVAVFQGTQAWIEGSNATNGATKGFALYDPAQPGNSLMWRDRSGNSVATFLNLDKVENAIFEEWGGSPYTYREWVLDDFVAFTYLTDPLSLGLFLNASDFGNDGNELAKYNNTEVYSRETTNTSRLPFLKVTVVPEPAALGLLGLGVLLIAQRRRRR